MVLAKNYDFRQSIFPPAFITKLNNIYIKILALENTFTNTHIIILNDTNLDFSIDYIIIEKLREKKKIIVYVWLGSRGVKEKKSLKRDWIWYKVVKNLYIVFRFASSIEREREREWVRWNRWIQSALNENFSFFLILFSFFVCNALQRTGLSEGGQGKLFISHFSHFTQSQYVCVINKRAHHFPSPSLLPDLS